MFEFNQIKGVLSRIRFSALNFNISLVRNLMLFEKFALKEFDANNLKLENIGFVDNN